MGMALVNENSHLLMQKLIHGMYLMALFCFCYRIGIWQLI